MRSCYRRPWPRRFLVAVCFLRTIRSALATASDAVEQRPPGRCSAKSARYLAVGCKYGETATGAYSTKPPREHIHIDINPASLGANYPTALAIAADAKVALRGLLARLEKDGRPVNATLHASIRQARSRAEAKSLTASASAVSPARFLQLLRRSLGPRCHYGHR